MTIFGVDFYGLDWFSLSVVANVLPKLISAARVTIYVSLLAFAGALVIGLVILLGQRSGISLVRRSSMLAVDFIRSTPLLLQIYFYFFVMPQIGIILPPITTGILALSIHYGCYVTEAYRAGLESLPTG